jgi:hypothetical protein
VQWGDYVPVKVFSRNEAELATNGVRCDTHFAAAHLDESKIVLCGVRIGGVSTLSKKQNNFDFKDVFLTGLMIAMLGCGSATAQSRDPAPRVGASLVAHALDVETVRFDPGGRAPVKIVRSDGATLPAALQAAGIGVVETVTFADPQANPVRVVRGDATGLAGAHDAGTPRRETVRFADAAEAPVTVIRGAALAAGVDLFAPADAADLDRVAFAVDGIESSHGLDPAMWRADAAGPQGPMQVSLAAALDVGGGDRFDPAQNRALGRAYLARLFGRYGDWADAVMAYNWGPANVDLWIAGGRPAAALPLEVEFYRDRVLRDAGLLPAGAGWPVLDLQHPGRLASLAPR